MLAWTRNSKFPLCTCMLLVLIAAPVCAEENTHKDDSWTVNLTFENDLFGDTDRHYTNGLKLGWISPDLSDYRDSPRLPSWTKNWIAWLPLINHPGLQRNVGLSIGQKLYTPEDIANPDPIRDDRPYAGWLYLSAAFYNKNPYQLDTLELQLGVVGPAALGEQSQNQIHRWRGIDTAKGWDHQLDDELGIAMIFERKWRVIRRYYGDDLGLDVIHHAGGALGNVHTYLNAGSEIRFGYNLPSDFGASLIRPGGDAFAPSDSSDPRYKGHDSFSLHGFIGVTGRLVLHDIFLDGNTFESSLDVDKRHLVSRALAGVSLVVGSYKISYAQVATSKEFRGQDSGQHFGSLSLSYTY